MPTLSPRVRALAFISVCAICARGAHTDMSLACPSLNISRDADARRRHRSVEALTVVAPILTKSTPEPQPERQESSAMKLPEGHAVMEHSYEHVGRLVKGRLRDAVPLLRHAAPSESAGQ